MMRKYCNGALFERDAWIAWNIPLIFIFKATKKNEPKLHPQDLNGTAVFQRPAAIMLQRRPVCSKSLTNK